MNLVPYGAFVELEEGVEGLVHIYRNVLDKDYSAWKFLMLEMKWIPVVLGIQDDQKISLGLRQLKLSLGYGYAQLSSGCSGSW